MLGSALVYLGVIIAVSYRYSYLILDGHEHKWAYFSLSSALALLGWCLAGRKLTKPAKTLTKSLVGLMAMYFINDTVFIGEFGMIDHVSTVLVLVFSIYMIYPIVNGGSERCRAQDIHSKNKSK